MSRKASYLIALFEEEPVLLEAIRQVRQKQVHIHEVFSPYPIHGIDEVLGYKRSRLPIAAFIFGMTGALLALCMQIGMMTFDWPMNIGGKDFLPWPTFIPVTFEVAVLLSAFGMVGVFFLASNLKPWAKPKIFDKRSTDDKHALVVNLSHQSQDTSSIESLLKEVGASEVHTKSL